MQLFRNSVTGGEWLKVVQLVGFRLLVAASNEQDLVGLVDGQVCSLSRGCYSDGNGQSMHSANFRSDLESPLGPASGFEFSDGDGSYLLQDLPLGALIWVE